jgi:hypothetical protein
MVNTKIIGGVQDTRSSKQTAGFATVLALDSVALQTLTGVPTRAQL